MESDIHEASSEINFVALMRAAYRKCQVASILSFAFTFALFVVALLSACHIFSDDNIAEEWQRTAILVLGFAFQACAVASRAFSDLFADRGAMLRHVAMLQNGLGIQPDRIDVAQWSETIGSATVIPDYYESKASPGSRRLVEITAESAFFSHVIARRSAAIAAASMVIGSLAVIIGIVAGVRSGFSQGAVELATEVGLTLLTFLVTGDLLLLFLRYLRTANNANRVLHECKHALQLILISSDAAHSVATEYQLVMASGPPMPALLYRSERIKLTEIYRKAMS